MDTEYRGYARFLAVASDNDKGDVPLCLTLDDNQKLLGAAPIQAAEKLEQQRWVAELQGDVTWANTDNKFVQKANFYLYNAYWNNKGQKRYLSLDNGQITTSTSPTSWKLEMVSLECKGLTMDSITLHSYMRDSKYSPSVEVRGSFPLTWSVNPKLPDFMTFDKETGEVSQQKGVEPPLFPKTNFTLSLSNPLNTISTTFSLEVTEFNPDILL